MNGPAPIQGDGSGETLVCLALAYAGEVAFVAEYDCSRPETMYDPEAPLVPLVRALAGEVRVLRYPDDGPRCPARAGLLRDLRARPSGRPDRAPRARPHPDVVA